MSPDAKNSAELPGDPNSAAPPPRRARGVTWVVVLSPLLMLAALAVLLINVWRQEGVREQQSERLRRIETRLQEIETQRDRLQKEGRPPLREKTGQ
jgi:hypothetical protein